MAGVDSVGVDSAGSAVAVAIGRTCCVPGLSAAVYVCRSHVAAERTLEQFNVLLGTGP